MSLKGIDEEELMEEKIECCKPDAEPPASVDYAQKSLEGTLTSGVSSFHRFEHSVDTNCMCLISFLLQ